MMAKPFHQVGIYYVINNFVYLCYMNILGVMILADPGYLMITNKQLTFDTEHCSNCGICVLNGIPSDENVFVRIKNLLLSALHLLFNALFYN